MTTETPLTDVLNKYGMSCFSKVNGKRIVSLDEEIPKQELMKFFGNDFNPSFVNTNSLNKKSITEAIENVAEFVLSYANCRITNPEIWKSQFGFDSSKCPITMNILKKLNFVFSLEFSKNSQSFCPSIWNSKQLAETLGISSEAVCELMVIDYKMQKIFNPETSKRTADKKIMDMFTSFDEYFDERKVQNFRIDLTKAAISLLQIELTNFYNTIELE